MKILPLEHIRDDLEAARVWVLLHMFYLDLDNALRKGELAALRLDMWTSKAGQFRCAGNTSVTLTAPGADPLKTENSVGQVSIPQAAVELLIQEHEKHPDRMVNLYK